MAEESRESQRSDHEDDAGRLPPSLGAPAAPERPARERRIVARDQIGRRGRRVDVRPGDRGHQAGRASREIEEDPGREPADGAQPERREGEVNEPHDELGGHEGDHDEVRKDDAGGEEVEVRKHHGCGREPRGERDAHPQAEPVPEGSACAGERVEDRGDEREPQHRQERQLETDVDDLARVDGADDQRGEAERRKRIPPAPREVGPEEGRHHHKGPDHRDFEPGQEGVEAEQHEEDERQGPPAEPDDREHDPQAHHHDDEVLSRDRDQVGRSALLKVGAEVLGDRFAAAEDQAAEEGADLRPQAPVEEGAEPGPDSPGRRRPLEDLVAVHRHDRVDALALQVRRVVELPRIRGRLGRPDPSPDPDSLTADQPDALPEVPHLDAVDDERPVLLGFSLRIGEGAVDARRPVDDPFERIRVDSGPAERLGGMLPDSSQPESEERQQDRRAPPYNEGGRRRAQDGERDPGVGEARQGDAGDESRGQRGDRPGPEHRQSILNR